MDVTDACVYSPETRPADTTVACWIAEETFGRNNVRAARIIESTVMIPGKDGLIVIFTSFIVEPLES